MATRSLLLSLTLTFILGYSFTVGLTDPNSFLKKIPDWLGIPLFLGCFLLYLLASWWAFKGFGDHKFISLVSMGFCVFSIGIYATIFAMEMGHGKAAKGQYDYDFTTLDPTEKAILTQITHDAGLGLQDAVFTEHWHIGQAEKATEPRNDFQLCVQKGHITALNLSDHPIQNLAALSQLPQLGDLYLRNCGLTDMSGLQSARLGRLDVSDNQITDLKTLRGCPNVQWLFAMNNRLTSTDGLDQFKAIVSTNFRGNSIPQ
ncbi:leucine-rich repeat domain-containing protein [Spirosoma litoris]